MNGQWVETASLWVYLLPVGVGVLRFRQLSSGQRWLWGLVLAGALVQWLGNKMGLWFGTNLPLFHAYILLEFAFYVVIFIRLEAPDLSKNILWGILGGFAGLFTLSVIWIEGPMEFPSLMRSVESFLLISLALRAFWVQLQHPTVLRLDKFFLFWLATGILLFFSGNSLLFIFMKRIARSQEEFFSIWILTHYLNIIFTLIYTIALTCKDPIPNSYKLSSPREF